MDNFIRQTPMQQKLMEGCQIQVQLSVTVSLYYIKCIRKNQDLNASGQKHIICRLQNIDAIALAQLTNNKKVW
jgi:hypothetical protein